MIRPFRVALVINNDYSATNTFILSLIKKKTTYIYNNFGTACLLYYMPWQYEYG